MSVCKYRAFIFLDQPPPWVSRTVNSPPIGLPVGGGGAWRESVVVGIELAVGLVPNPFRPLMHSPRWGGQGKKAEWWPGRGWNLNLNIGGGSWIGPDMSSQPSTAPLATTHRWRSVSFNAQPQGGVCAILLRLYTSTERLKRVCTSPGPPLKIYYFT